MRISDWSSDVCSSDLALLLPRQQERVEQAAAEDLLQFRREVIAIAEHGLRPAYRARQAGAVIPAAEHALEAEQQAGGLGRGLDLARAARQAAPAVGDGVAVGQVGLAEISGQPVVHHVVGGLRQAVERIPGGRIERSEEHTSELQSLMRISYAVFCLKKKKEKQTTKHTVSHQHKN